MKTLIIVLGLAVFFSISIPTGYAGDTIPPIFPQDTPSFSDSAIISLEDNPNFFSLSDTPALNDMATAIRTPPDCDTPVSGPWTISQDCFLASTFNAPANVIVQNGALLVIPNGVQLNIDFVNSNLTIKSGSGVLIKAGGSIT